MSLKIGFLFLLLAGTIFLFPTEKRPVYLTAFLGLVVLIFGGDLSPAEPFTGFSSPAVITMPSLFIIGLAIAVHVVIVGVRALGRHGAPPMGHLRYQDRHSRRLFSRLPGFAICFRDERRQPPCSVPLGGPESPGKMQRDRLVPGCGLDGGRIARHLPTRSSTAATAPGDSWFTRQPDLQ